MNADQIRAMSPTLARELAAALARNGARVELIETEADRAWLKRVEVLAGVLRLQKGDPRRALDAERRGLRLLGERGLPVVPLLAEGPDWLLTGDCGPTAEALLRAETLPAVSVARLMAAVGSALGALHQAGVAHGRPVLRDVCWDGRRALFIDLERYRDGRAGPWRQALDMAILVQSWFARYPADPAGFDVAAAAWAPLAGPAALQRAVWLGWVLGWIGPLAKLLARARPGSRETAALPLTLGYLRRLRLRLRLEHVDD